MRALVQRVTSARVAVAPTAPEHRDSLRRITGEIGRGLVVLVGVTHDDDRAVARKLADKVWHLRVFDDADGAMNVAVGEAAGGALLVVSQFTLYGDTRRGRRPSWGAVAPPEHAEPLLEVFVAALRDLGAHVETGQFRTMMTVELVNDGPVTLLLEA